MKNLIFKIQRKNFSGAEKIIKMRMKAVGSIGKITKAMKMVASSKRRLDLLRLTNGKNFGVNVMTNVFENDNYSKRLSSENEPSKILLIPITSDRGLCGGINSNLIRHLREMVNPNREKFQILPIGDKGTQALVRPYPDIFNEALTDLQTPINFYNVATLTEHILNYDFKWDSLWILHNEYINTISWKIKNLQIMNKNDFKKRFYRLSTYDISEPDHDISMPAFYELYVASQLHYALLQNAACEQSARMNAMENASSNAKDILEKLTLKYNKARQARITMELVEIISGASAL